MAKEVKIKLVVDSKTGIAQVDKLKKEILGLNKATSASGKTSGVSNKIYRDTQKQFSMIKRLHLQNANDQIVFTKRQIDMSQKLHLQGLNTQIKAAQRSEKEKVSLVNTTSREKARIQNNYNKAHIAAITENNKRAKAAASSVLKTEIAAANTISREKARIQNNYNKAHIAAIIENNKRAKAAASSTANAKVAAANAANAAQLRELKRIERTNSGYKKLDKQVKRTSANTVSAFNRIGLASQRAMTTMHGGSANMVTSFGAINASAVRIAIGMGLLTAAMTSLVGEGKDFEYEMAGIEGIMGATEKEMKSLTVAARKMGATTEWTANQSAEALTYMARAGWEAEESIEALPIVLNLATATGVDLAKATSIATDNLKALGLEVDSLTHFVDVMVATTNMSNTDLEKMSGTFKYVAAGAKNLGYSLEQMAAITGVLANSNLKGTLSGRQLRHVFIENSKAAEMLGTDYDDLIGTLEAAVKAGWGFIEFNEVYGKIGGTTAQVLANNIKKIKDLEKKLSKAAGTARRMADIRLNTLTGEVTLFTSSISDLKQEFFDAFGDDIQKMFKSAKKSVLAIGDAVKYSRGELDLLSGSSEAAKENLDKFAKILNYIKNILLVIVGYTIFSGITKALIKLLPILGLTRIRLKSVRDAFVFSRYYGAKLPEAIGIAAAALTRLNLVATSTKAGLVGITIAVSIMIASWLRGFEGLKNAIARVMGGIVYVVKLGFLKFHKTVLQAIDLVKRVVQGSDFVPNPQIAGTQKQIDELKRSAKELDDLINVRPKSVKNMEYKVALSLLKKTNKEIERHMKTYNALGERSAGWAKRRASLLEKQKEIMEALVGLKEKHDQPPKLTKEEKKGIADKIPGVVEKSIKSGTAEYEKGLKERLPFIEKMNKEIQRMTKSNYEYERYLLDLEVKGFEAVGLHEIEYAEYVATKLKDIAKREGEEKLEILERLNLETKRLTQGVYEHARYLLENEVKGFEKAGLKKIEFREYVNAKLKEIGNRELEEKKEFNDKMNQLTLEPHVYEILKIEESLEKYKAALMERGVYHDILAEKVKVVTDKMLEENKGAFEKWTDSVKGCQEILNDVAVSAAEGFASGMTDALMDFIDGTKSAKEAFKDFARSFLRDVAKMIMQQIILNSLKSVIGFGFAEGGVIKGGFDQVQGFASGGVATGPTLGVIGEGSKPEAVVPLDNGMKIPVNFRDGGGGGKSGNEVNTNIVVNVSQGSGGKQEGKTTEQFGNQLGRLVAVEFSRNLDRELLPGGKLNKSSAGGY